MRTRRDFLQTLGAAVPLAAPLPASAAEQWNVLFIGVDDLRPQIGCYGDRLAHTPNIDSIAARGTIFRHNYCQQAICGPSRASLLTGLRPDTIRVWDLTTRFRDAVPDAVTLPQLFKQHGYFTQNIGKIFHSSEIMNDRESWSVPEQLNTITKFDQYVLEKNKDSKDEWHKTACLERVDVPDTAYIDGRIADAGVAAVRQAKDRPFFLAVGFNKPHLPFAAPKRYWDLFDRQKFTMPAAPQRPRNVPPFAISSYSELRSYDDVPDDGPIPEAQIREILHGYYAAAAYTDASIGRVLAELRRQNLAEKTIVVLWADHGWHLGEQDYWGKTTNFEVCARVPLIVSVPGKKRQGSDSIIEHLDIYPTLAELCGLAAPARLEGKSFARLLDDANLAHKQAAYSQYPRKEASTGNEPLMGYTMRTPRFRYTEWLSADRSIRATELYDHQTDPHETRNAASEAIHRETIAGLSAMMHRDLSLPARTTKEPA